MEILIRKSSDSVIAVMNGCFDTQAAEMYEPTVKELESLASKPIILDCRRLEYIASSGLRVLLRLRKACAAQGQRVTLQGVNPNIMEVLKVTHFDSMFIFE
ncbi:MAG: STAS domain-containing protein [Alistipes sp.]|nr:STAS domain-containing protein [Candidatus Alistipes equi]